MSRGLRLVIVVAFAGWASVGQTAQEDGGSPSRGQNRPGGGAPLAGGAPEFPNDPGLWINSGPLSMESLRGKGVFLYFFEETCPSCRNKWPSMLATARKAQGKPILFIAVNSGNPRETVEQYARETGVTWPILVDPSRGYEAKCDVGEISLRNIAQVKLITADGRMKLGSWSDIDQSIADALRGAKWRVDPTNIPAALRGAWSAIEFGDFAAAAPQVARALASSNPALKAAGELLDEAVQKEIADALGPADDTLAREEPWEAYKAIDSVARRFRGYKLPDRVESDRKRLADDPKVKEELAGRKRLEAARRLLARSATRKRGVAQLKKLALDQSETEAGREAKQWIDR